MSAVNWATATDAEKCATVLAATLNAPAEGATYESVVRASREGVGCPDYLTDPRAWWPLVEEMGADICTPNAGDDTVYVCEWYLDGRSQLEFASTPAAAVCIAYLLWKGWTVETP